MTIGIILAKGYSSRLKNKNFRTFHGKPMISWTIQTAIKSKLFDKIIVSTDEKKIINRFNKFNIEFVLRPKELSKEKYGIDEVMKYTIKKLNYNYKYACCLFPSAPLLSHVDLIKGLKKIKKFNYNYVFAASNFSHPIERSFKINNKKIKMVFSKRYMQYSSKFLSDTYYDTGYFYWAKTSTWRNKFFNYNNNTSIIKIPNWRAQDIDTKDDLKKTDLLFKSLKKKL